MRIGIDYWPATTHAPGVGRYVRELVRALVRLEQAPQLGLFDVGPGPRTVPPAMLGLERSGARVRRLRLRIPLRAIRWLPGGADRLLGGCALFQRAFPDRPPVARARTAATLAEIPAPGSPGHAALRTATAALDGVLVTCESARAAACERLDLDPARVHVVGVGCEHWLRAPGGAQAPSPEAPARLVALGRVDRARQPLFLLRAAEALARGGRELELVFAGRPGDAAAELRGALARTRIRARWLESPSEKELPALVGAAAALVQLEPEAFTAVTPLEALAAGAAVVATRLPAFEEALGDQAEWIDPRAEGAELDRQLGAALERALASALDPGARARRARLAAAHTWERAARLTLEAWGRILSPE